MKNSKILAWVLTVAMVVVLNLFFHFAINLVYAPVQWDDYCRPEMVKPMPEAEKLESYVDPYAVCQKQYDDVRTVYDRNVFVALVVLGLISLVTGTYLTVSGPVAIGLSLGGVLSFMVAAIGYWRYMDEYLRVVILGIALVVLIWLGIKKLRE